jgi:hypothetical protein
MSLSKVMHVKLFCTIRKVSALFNFVIRRVHETNIW